MLEALPFEIQCTTQAFAGRRFHALVCLSAWWFLLRYFLILLLANHYSFATAEKIFITKMIKNPFCYSKYTIFHSKAPSKSRLVACLFGFANI
jgi:hypothetical protein